MKEKFMVCIFFSSKYFISPGFHSVSLRKILSAHIFVFHCYLPFILSTHGGLSLAHHGVYGLISVSKYLGLYASLRILGWMGCLNTEL